MLSTFATRGKFIASVISLLRTYDFDGLDLFFLYPGLRGSPRHDRWTFLFLIKELLFAFQEEALLTMRPRLLLSAAVSGVPHIVKTSYKVRFLGRLLDFINVLSYDLHGSWEGFTGHNSPLFSLPDDPKSSAYAMNYWRKLGAPSEKLIMGIPTYGRTFHLLEASNSGLQARAMGPASPGKYTKQAGLLAYYEICSFVWGAKKHWIDYQYVPYANKGDEWVGYDDAISFTYKAWFIKREHFGGAMVWTLDMDDVRGTFCGTGPFPLVYVLNDILVRAVFNSTSSPQFWLSSSVNSLSTDPSSTSMLAVTKASTTDTKILPPGGETDVTEIHGKYENMTITPRGTTVTLTKETVSLGKHIVARGEKTEIPGAKTMSSVGHHFMTPGEKALTPVGHHYEPSGNKTLTSVGHQSLTPGEKTLTPVGHQSVTPGEKTLTPVGHQSVTPGEKTLTPVGHQFVTLGNKTLTPVGHQSVTPGEKTLTPVGHQSVTPGEKTLTPVGHQSMTPGEKTLTPVSHQSMTPGEKTLTPVGHQSATPGQKTLTPVGHQSVTPGEKTLTPVGHQSVTPGEKTLTPVVHQSVTLVSHQSVNPGEMTMTPVHFQTETLRENAMAPRRQAVALEKVTVPSRKVSVSPEGQSMPLRGENLTSEVGIDPTMGNLGLEMEAEKRMMLPSSPIIQFPEGTPPAFDNRFVPVYVNHSSVNSTTPQTSPLSLKKENPENSAVDQGA
ncbi:oviduct-specific glycoprotein [Callithrix jacchus]